MALQYSLRTMFEKRKIFKDLFMVCMGSFLFHLLKSFRQLNFISFFLCMKFLTKDTFSHTNSSKYPSKQTSLLTIKLSKNTFGHKRRRAVQNNDCCENHTTNT